MYSPSLEHLLVQAHVKDLRRARQAWNTLPITTNERMAARDRIAGQLSAYLARAIERFIGHAGPPAPAF